MDASRSIMESGFVIPLELYSLPFKRKEEPGKSLKPGHACADFPVHIQESQSCQPDSSSNICSTTTYEKPSENPAIKPQPSASLNTKH